MIRSAVLVLFLIQNLFLGYAELGIGSTVGGKVSFSFH
jgi:hypothetical protein